MDPLSIRISSININELTLISVFIDEYLYLILLFLFSFLFYKYHKSKSKELEIRIKTLAVCLVLFLFLVPALKSLFNYERPCEILNSKIECKEDKSFPSGHASFASLFLLALDSYYFVAYFLFFVLVIFSRVYLGVHSFYDVVFGTVLGVIFYLVVYSFFVTKKVVKIRERAEFWRQVFHLGFGIFAIFFVLVFELPIYLFFAILICLIFLSKFDLFFEDLIRDLGYRDFYKCYGAILYVVGIILILLFVKEKEYIVSFIYILAVCDTVPNFFEKVKKERGFFKRGITGIFANFIFTMFIPVFLLGEEGMLFSLVCVALEGMDLKIDDNILIPTACILAKNLI